MSAATINAMFQWIVSFFQKLGEKFAELMGILSPEADTDEA